MKKLILLAPLLLLACGDLSTYTITCVVDDKTKVFKNVRNPYYTIYNNKNLVVFDNWNKVYDATGDKIECVAVKET
jgi:hypothetical protein